MADMPETVTLTYSALRALLESVAAGDSINDAMLTATDELDVARIGGPLDYLVYCPICGTESFVEDDPGDDCERVCSLCEAAPGGHQ